MEQVFLQDKLVAADEAAISIDDSSFLYGIGLFETMRAVKGRVFRLDDHLNRLFASARALSILNSCSVDFLHSAVDQVLAANELSEARLRLTLTSGPLHAGEHQQSTLLITATRLVPYPEEYFEKGVRVIVTDFRQNSKDPFSGHKTTCYGPRLAVLREAHEKLSAEALWFTTENHLAEGCISNVFLVREGRLLTPPETTPVLPGIARKTVMEIAEKENIPLDINDLLGAQEVFLTNVIMTLLPVTSVEAHVVGDGKPGIVTQQLRKEYTDLLERGSF